MLFRSNTVILECTNESRLIYENEELLQKTRELIFNIRTGKTFEIKINFKGLSEVRTNCNKLIKKNKLTTDEQEQRNLCQKYFNDLDKKSKRTVEILLMIFSECDGLYTSFGEIAFAQILQGVFDTYPLTSMRTNLVKQGTKIDIWKPKEDSFSTSIDTTSDELGQILEKLDLNNTQMLAQGAGNYWVMDLPRQIIYSKVIPAIGFHLSWHADRTKKEVKEFSHKLNLLEWSIGLG